MVVVFVAFRVSGGGSGGYDAPGGGGGLAIVLDDGERLIRFYFYIFHFDIFL